MGKGTDRDRMGPTRGPRRLYDWTALRTRYIAADCSQAEFAEREGVTLSKLKARASAEGWNAAREAHRAKVAAKVEAKVAERKAKTEAEIDADAHEFALAAMRKVRALLDAAGTDDEGGVDAREVKALVDAHRAAYEQARIAARLTPMPVPVAATDPADDGEVTIVRRRPDGSETEVTFGARPADRRDADADAVPVPRGPDEPGEGADRRAG